MSCRRESPRREFTPVVVSGREFHSGTKSRNGIMWTRNDHPLRCEFGLPPGTGSACVMFAILNRTCILSTWSIPSNNPDMKWPMIMWTRYQINKSCRYENSRRCEFSHVNSPSESVIRRTLLAEAHLYSPTPLRPALTHFTCSYSPALPLWYFMLTSKFVFFFTQIIKEQRYSNLYINRDAINQQLPSSSLNGTK